MKNLVTVFLLMLFSAAVIRANNIAVSGVSLTDQSVLFNHCNVKFDLSWENSWRALSVPGNWDAAWVFVKYRVSGGEWHHASLDTAADNHTPAAGCQITPGKDFKGVFIYRSSTGAGNNTWSNIKLRWKYGMDGVPDDATLEVKVFAIEMVYVPQGSFYIGDGNGTDESTGAFHNPATDNAFLHITGNAYAEIAVDNSSGYDDGYIHHLGDNGLECHGEQGVRTTYNSNPITIFPYYPTGYRPFYVMKYEVSQEQYADFLNCLTRAQQVNRVQTDISIGTTNVTNRFVMSGNTGAVGRNGIRCDATIPAAAPVTFYCDLNSNGTGNETGDGQNIACDYTSWLHSAAYADWAGLRPMTELEYEKACRGPNQALYGEFAWGTVNIFGSGYTITGYGYPNEGIPNLGAGTGNAVTEETYSLGPVRCGIFAAGSANHTRQETGATYFGIMEMTGNLAEFCVTLGNSAGRSFTGLQGDGELDASGYGNVDHWPGINGNNMAGNQNMTYGGVTGITQGAGIGIRGGDYTMFAGSYYDLVTLSARMYASTPSYVVSNKTGIRCSRTAP